MENPVKEKSETTEDLKNLINEIIHNYNESENAVYLLSIYGKIE